FSPAVSWQFTPEQSRSKPPAISSGISFSCSTQFWIFSRIGPEFPPVLTSTNGPPRNFPIGPLHGSCCSGPRLAPCLTDVILAHATLHAPAPFHIPSFAAPIRSEPRFSEHRSLDAGKRGN